MIRRRNLLWVQVHDMTLTAPNRRLLTPDTGHTSRIPVTYSSSQHHRVALGNITELTPFPGYITGTGKVESVSSGPDSLAEVIARNPYTHRSRAEWAIDIDSHGELMLVIRAIHITRSQHPISYAEVGVTPPKERKNPSPYIRSRMDTSHAATGVATVESPSPPR